jgi:hypothetical protein
MKKYIALGCSLTARDGYVNYINSVHGLDILNLAVAAGSNQLQTYRLNNLLVNRDVGSESILLWQITGIGRNFELLPAQMGKSYCSGTPYQGMFDWTPEKIQPWNEEYVSLLSNNPYHNDRFNNNKLVLHDLMCNIYKWSCIVNRIIVYFGWNSISDTATLNTFVNFIRQRHNVTVLPYRSSILDWCKKQQLEFEDDRHPSKNSYIKWGSDVLVPVLLN